MATFITSSVRRALDEPEVPALPPATEAAAAVAATRTASELGATSTPERTSRAAISCAVGRAVPAPVPRTGYTGTSRHSHAAAEPPPPAPPVPAEAESGVPMISESRPHKTMSSESTTCADQKKRCCAMLAEIWDARRRMHVRANVQGTPEIPHCDKHACEASAGDKQYVQRKHLAE